jgi:glucosamine--fructose-6-phosphate aminotransferase (isomerizing)
MSYMLDEIHQQPDVIRGLVDAERENVRNLAKEIKSRDIRFGLIAARGTSDNAATYGKYLLEIVNGLPVGLAAPSVFTLYGAKPRLNNSLVIGISQSGQAADAIEYLQRSKECGALTACVTNEPGSEMTKAADFCLLCHAGPERSVAATKTYTATLAVLCLLSAGLAGRDDLVDELLKTPGQIEQVIRACEGELERRAERYRYMEDCIVLARGISRATAFEAALKLAETCHVNVEPFSSADFLHGPITIVQEGVPCFLYTPEGPTFGSMLDMARRLTEKRAELIIISNNEDILSMATTPFRIPVQMNDILSPIVYIVVGQIFAQYLAVTKGLDPDHPRGLSKVTITR